MPTITPAQKIFGQQKAVDSKKTFGVQYTITVSELDLLFDTYKGYDIVQLRDGTCINDVGKPMMPAKEIKIALPAGMAATAVNAVDSTCIDLKGTYTIFPAQPPRRTDDSSDTATFIEPDPTVYKANQQYPGQLVNFVGQTDLAGQGIAVIAVYPLQYVPSEKKLMLYTSITFVITGTDGYICGDYLSRYISDSGREIYEQMIKDMVINPEDVEFRVSDSPQTTGVGPGRYDYVIITQDGWVSAFTPLKDWKTKKGIPANIVTTTWIYNSGGYSGNNQQKIRAFIIDAYNNWGAIFFLLGGDTGIVPYYTKTISPPNCPPDGINIPTDTYYSDYDDDWICEVHVGRAPVTTASEITIFINKIFNYEKNPPLTDYCKTAFFCGFDLYTSGSGEGAACKEYIKNNYLSGWTYRYEYDSETTNHKTEVLNNLNLGYNLVNHADHSNTDSMGTGWTNHNFDITTSDALSRTNSNKQSIIYSMGCWACDYADAECIAEGFLHNSNGGGIAFIGNSRYGWYQPYQSDGLSFRYDRYFFRSLLQQNNYKLGITFSDHKNDQYPSDIYYQYIFTELTLLGDPEMPVWKENPTSISVSHPSTLPTGTSAFLVDTNVPNAYICLWKGTEVYMTGTANANGDYTFYPNPTTEGTMFVTVTAQNRLPYEGTATVTSPQYTLTITINPVGGGTVIKNPNLPTYPAGQIVQLIANPNPGWRFSHWSGALTGSTNPTTITMDSDKTVTAHFLQNEYTLTLITQGSGTVQKIPNQPTYHYDDLVDLIAIPTNGWSFSHWSGDHSGSENPTTITISGNTTITATFTPNPFVLNLVNFPIYQAQAPYNQMCGPACAQMTLNYMWWNQTQNPNGPPPLFNNQQWLYTVGHANNTDQTIPYLDVNGLWKLLQTYEPLPYSTYGYNFNIYSNTEQNIMLRQICTWINYTIGTYGGYKPGHPQNVPTLIPAYGDYSNWMAVRGIHTDRYTYPLPNEFTIYGFWVNDPLPTGIGANSYKTINEWTSTYYLPLTSNDVYNGKYVALCEPPIDFEQNILHMMSSPERFTTVQQYVFSYMRDMKLEHIPPSIKKLTNDWVVQAAITAIKEQLVPYDEEFTQIFQQTQPGVPIYVESLQGNNYYAVPFILDLTYSKGQYGSKKQPHPNDATMIVILIDATDGHFKEASWTQNPMKYLPIGELDARKKAVQFLEENGFYPDASQITCTLLYRGNSPYYPDWLVTDGNIVLYIRQDGTLYHI